MAVQVGGWGGDGGNEPWEFTLKDHSKLTSITVRSDSSCVYSITFTYKDKDGEYHSKPHGPDSGTAKTFTLANGEYLCAFSGTYGFHLGSTAITSLSFQGSKDSSETFGKPQGTYFSLPLVEGKFVGFFGNYKHYMDSIGAMLSP